MQLLRKTKHWTRCCILSKTVRNVQLLSRSRRQLFKEPGHASRYVATSSMDRNESRSDLKLMCQATVVCSLCVLWCKSEVRKARKGDVRVTNRRSN